MSLYTHKDKESKYLSINVSHNEFEQEPLRLRGKYRLPHNAFLK